MQKKILTEKTLKEATIKACETELRMYDKLIEETTPPAFSDKFEKEMQKIIEKNNFFQKCVTFCSPNGLYYI